MNPASSGENWQKNDVLLGAGSNMGERESYLARAAEQIQALAGVSCFCASSIFYTEPQLVLEQDWFANQVFVLRCDERWTPLALLRQLLAIEQEQGRVRLRQYGPRTLDLDLLLFGDTVVSSPELTLPHPRLHERAFVLVPLLELRPDFVFPDGESARQKLARLQYRVEGRRIWQEEMPSPSA